MQWAYALEEAWPTPIWTGCTHRVFSDSTRREIPARGFEGNHVERVARLNCDYGYQSRRKTGNSDSNPGLVCLVLRVGALVKMRMLSQAGALALIAVLGILLVFFCPAASGPYSVTNGPATAFRALAAARGLFAAIGAALLVAALRCVLRLDAVAQTMVPMN